MGRAGGFFESESVGFFHTELPGNRDPGGHVLFDSPAAADCTRSLLSAEFRVNRHYQSRVKLTLSCCFYVTGISQRRYMYYIGPDRVLFGRFGAISELTDYC